MGLAQPAAMSTLEEEHRLRGHISPSYHRDPVGIRDDFLSVGDRSREALGSEHVEHQRRQREERHQRRHHDHARDIRRLALEAQGER
jgi:hypothetical protein